jgi:hypothetical protein
VTATPVRNWRPGLASCHDDPNPAEPHWSRSAPCSPAEKPRHRAGSRFRARSKSWQAYHGRSHRPDGRRARTSAPRGSGLARLWRRPVPSRCSAPVDVSLYLDKTERLPVRRHVLTAPLGRLVSTIRALLCPCHREPRAAPAASASWRWPTGASAPHPRPPSAEWSWRGQTRNRVIVHRCLIRACGFSAPYAPDGFFFTTPGGIRNSARWSLAPAPQPGKALGLIDPTVDVQSIRVPTGRCC